MLSYLFLPLLLLSGSFASYVTFPLYIDPSGNGWQSLYDQLGANPQLTFNLIINPASGPGSSQYPDEDTLSGLSHVNTYPNVNTLGYVHVDWCSRSLSEVQADVQRYAGWASYTGSDIHLDGIFFDEAPADYSDSSHSYMTTASGYVKSAFPAGKNHVSFNPGAITDGRYFDVADSICVFEDQYSAFSSNTLSSIPADQKASSTIIIYGFSGSQDQQNSVVQQITSNGISGLFITSNDGYTSFSNIWPEFVNSMASNGGSGMPPPASPSTPQPSSSVASSGPSSTSASPTAPSSQPPSQEESEEEEEGSEGSSSSSGPTPTPSSSSNGSNDEEDEPDYDEENDDNEGTPTTSGSYPTWTSTGGSPRKPHHHHRHSWNRPSRYRQH